jgi:hypothetical protein
MPLIRKEGLVKSEILDGCFTRNSFCSHYLRRFSFSVLQAAVGLWDIRKAMLAGQRRALAKYLDFLHEFSGIRIQEQRNVTRADVSQNILLLDLSNYSRKQHGCAACKFWKMVHGSLNRNNESLHNLIFKV